MDKTYYTIYKTINRISGKTYIGKHKTTDLDDGYMGSGKYLRRAIEKYGIENFTKELLFVFDSAQDMNDKEKELVNEDYLETNTYNLKIGGEGGFDWINSNRNLVNEKYTPEKRKATGNYKIGQKALRELYKNEEYFDKFKQNVSKSRIKYFKENGHPWVNRKHKSSTKELIGEKNSISQRGNRNSQYGKEWITNGLKNLSVKKGTPYPEGFRKGRFIHPSNNSNSTVSETVYPGAEPGG